MRIYLEKELGSRSRRALVFVEALLLCGMCANGCERRRKEIREESC